jgi:hypothetical protein
MALTAAQRRRLPKSAFAVPSRRAYPIPTKAQARRAGISEAQWVRTVRNALARSAQPQTSSSYRTIAPVARKRAGGQVRSVSRSAGTVTRPGLLAGRLSDAHAIELLTDDAWTAFTTGPLVRQWGFHTARGWVHWTRYPDAGSYAALAGHPDPRPYQRWTRVRRLVDVDEPR